MCVRVCARAFVCVCVCVCVVHKKAVKFEYLHWFNFEI